MLETAITIVHLETQNNYKLKVKSSRIKQVSFYNILIIITRILKIAQNEM